MLEEDDAPLEPEDALLELEEELDLLLLLELELPPPPPPPPLLLLELDLLLLLELLPPPPAPPDCSGPAGAQALSNMDIITVSAMRTNKTRPQFGFEFFMILSF